ncbi:MAG: radical SAM family heme chaperone HemW [Cyanobacteria bacterium J06598_1]
MPSLVWPKAAYIHIPFCRRRCFYCDFAISVVGDRKRGDTSPTIASYLKTLIAEIKATPVLGKPPNEPSLKTVFFGGGTPSLLSVSQLETILQALNDRFGIASEAEISMEMDPATFELSHAQGYRAAGINRVSLGAQAFQDEILAASGRFHRRADIVRAVEILRQANFDNISLDLMSGLPHQTMEHWYESLAAAIALNPTHLSIYDLIVEPQTAFSRYFTPGQAPLPSDRLTADMYRVAQEQLIARGYDHYEICNYAQPGYDSQHNLTYWRCEPNYGFGMGATSFLPKQTRTHTEPQRIDRPRTQASYREWVKAFIENGSVTDELTLPPDEQVLETVMMGLRLAPGISMAGVYAVYGEAGLAEVEKAITPHVQNGWVIVDPMRSISSQTPTNQTSSDVFCTTHLSPTSHIRLSDPEGFLMSNVVITDTFNALERVHRK